MKFVNIKVIMDRVTRHPLLQDIPFETVIDYAVDFIRIVGTPPSFMEKTADIHIKDYRGELPCDFYNMIQVRYGKKEGRALRYSTDNFHFSEHKKHWSDRRVHDLTYKLQGNCIFTSFEEGIVEIAYQAMPMDDDGYPLIPDNSSYERALEAYIKKQWFTIQYDLGKINPQIMMKADQDYAWAVGQAQTDLIMPTIDQMQSITNMWNSLLDRREHATGFINQGTKEHIRIH